MQNKPKEEIDLLIQKLRDRLEDFLPINQKFDNNFYLYRWLIQYYMNVDTTAKAIKESIGWRTENNVEQLAEEEWGSGSGLENVLKATFGSVTKTGQPVATLDAENIDNRAIFREYSKESFRKILNQFAAKLEKVMLESYQKGLEAESNSTSLNSGYHPSWFSTASVVIVSFKNFYFSNLTHLEVNKFSGSVAKLMKPLLASDAFVLELFDTDKPKWSSKFLEIVNEDQLPVSFGGTYVEADDSTLS